MLSFIVVLLALGYLSILIGAVIHTLWDLGAMGTPHLGPNSDGDDPYEEEWGGSASPTVAQNAEFVAETTRRGRDAATIQQTSTQERIR
jgi:hypothetical protein